MKSSFADKLSNPQATLDLHKYGPVSLPEVESIVEEFLQNSYAEGLNKVLIITGKGLNSPDGPKLRPLVLKFLRNIRYIRTFHLASPERGGEGAIELYFKDLS